MKDNFKLASVDEIHKYIIEKVKPGDEIGLSLGRCYVPGTIVTNNNGVLQIDVRGESVKGLSSIDVNDLKDFLVEVKHKSDDGVYILEATDNE